MRKRKPDALMLLAMLIGLGVLATGIVQGAMDDTGSQTALSTQK
jgi:hypothetical protein